MTAETRRLRATLENAQGLHLRPLQLFVQTAMAYASTLRVGRTDREERVNGKSIMEMMRLEAERGAELELLATGPDADRMLSALQELIRAKFSED